MDDGPAPPTPAEFARYAPLIEQALRQAVGGDAPHELAATPLYEILRYHLGWTDESGATARQDGGKALRPTVCLLACEAVCGDPTPALPAAAAIELLHNFSLIHDDIEDGDRTRRGRPTAWTLWGEPQAINAGDGMWAVSTRTLLQAVEAGQDPALVVQALRLLNEASLTMIEGQAMDIRFEQAESVGADEYLDMIGRKTGILIARSYAIGALMAGADPQTVAAFEAYGRLVGRVFQIRDDVLGIWGDEAVTGKSATNDLRRHKRTYPVVLALGQQHKAAYQFGRLFARPELDDDTIARMVSLLNEMSIREQAMEMAAAVHAESSAKLSEMKLPGTAQEALDGVARFLLQRDK